jgi:Kef-type K+ transport system membrane component KefB
MNRAAQQSWVGRFAWATVVLSAIALVLILSTAITLSAGHSLDQITLALPVFFVFWFMARSLGDWLDMEEFSFEPKPRLSAALTRGPPA